LDPNFALAYDGLAASYGDIGETDNAIVYEKKAFALRDRVSEREKYRLTSDYCWLVTGDVNKETETEEAWRHAYPHDGIPSNNLAASYFFYFGQPEKAIEFADDSIHSQNAGPAAYIVMAAAYVALHRMDEAKAVIRDSIARRPDDLSNHQALYLIAVLEGDERGMQREFQRALGKQGEELSLSMAGSNAVQHGKLAEARRLFAQGVESTRGRNFREPSAAIAAAEALVEAEVGNSSAAKAQLRASLAMARSRSNLGVVAVAFALAGGTAEAHAAMSEIQRRYPQDTALQSVYLPAADAALKLRVGKPAESIAELQAAKCCELGANFGFLPIYIRGQAYLSAQQGAEAAREFRYIIEHRNFSPVAPEYALAYLGLARAYKMSNDPNKSRSAYQDFLALWKDADPDIPILKQAKAEYAKLQ
jgi:tetratricopeptide (TPR) repeat protein